MPHDESYGQPGDDRLDTGDVRRVVSTALVVIGCALLFVGGITLYARQEVFHDDNFSSRATSALADDDVRTVVSDHVVDEIIDQGSAELIQAKPLLEAIVSNVLESRPFRSLFRRAAVEVHRALFSRDEGSIVLDLADTGTVVIAAARAVAPGVAKEIPSGVQPELVRVSDDRVEIVERSELRIDVDVARDVVAVVGARRRVERRQPDRVDAELAEVGQPCADPGEVADAVAWLSSDGAGAVNGQAVVLDGGGIQA